MKNEDVKEDKCKTNRTRMSYYSMIKAILKRNETKRTQEEILELQHFLDLLINEETIDLLIELLLSS